MYASMQNNSEQYAPQADYNQGQQTATDNTGAMQGSNTQGYYPEFTQQSPVGQTVQPSSSPRQNSYFPDYDSIGADTLPSIDALTGNGDGLANFSDLIQPNKNIVSQEPQQQSSAPQVMGPKKNCPHCGAVNPAGEYYCNSCGKPF